MLPKSNIRKWARRNQLMRVVVACAYVSPALGAEIAAVGPVESIDCNSKTVRVLGINFRAINSQDSVAICTGGLPYELLYVAVQGRDAGDAVEINKYSLISKGSYVPGATEVYVRGAITTANIRTGEIGISGAAVSGVDASHLLGKYAEVVGTQPNLGGSILVTSDADLILERHAAVQASESSSGFEVLASSRSGTMSSSGSGKLSSSGSGVLSSSGSGKLSSSGSGVLSSSGSGKLSSSGSGKLSSSGSGVLSSSGSGKLSSSGSGKLSSSGSGVLSSSDPGF